MPKVTSHTPGWLSRPSPGFDFFTSQAEKAATSGTTTSSEADDAPSRTIAVRGTEIFYARGNEIRWADLSTLKELGENSIEQYGRRSHRQDSLARRTQPYRTLKVSGSRKVRQLLISPNGLYIAIVSSHTVHVAILPDPSHLSSEDTNPLKLKTYHVGPTTHVVERSPIAAALWHPLGVNGDCLVTVTSEAVVRLWEFDRNNRWSFDQPSVAVDLRKLANGSSTAEDFSPSKYGTSKGFSPDSFEMEVASACFGASGSEDEGSWAPMTLWVAMREGDVYALCPLLPGHFQAQTSTMRQLLSNQQVDFAAVDSLEATQAVPGWMKRGQRQQSLWMSEIEEQLEDDEDGSLPTQVLRRPARSSLIPKLQGPFHFSPDPDQIFDITDICSLTLDQEQDDLSDMEEDPESKDLDYALESLCLATSDGKAHVCINMNKIEPRWLPSKRTSSVPFSEPEEDNHDLLILESISLTPSDNTSCWPLFTPDATSPSRAFVTHLSGITLLDVSPFQRKLADEITNPGTGDQGIDFRIGILLDDTASTSTTCISFPPWSEDTPPSQSDILTPISLLHPDLGHILLTTTPPTGPLTATIPTPLPLLSRSNSSTSSLTSTLDRLALPPSITSLDTTRDPYTPAQQFYAPSSLASSTQAHPRRRNEEVRLSPATLDLLMSIHRTLSGETHKLGLAAAELFAKAERLGEEFRRQIRGVGGAVEMGDSVTGRDQGDEGEEGGNEGIKESIANRIHTTRTNQEALVARYEELRRKVAGLDKRPFSEREREWASEVGQLGGMVLGRDAVIRDRDGEIDGQDDEGDRVDGEEEEEEENEEGRDEEDGDEGEDEHGVGEEGKTKKGDFSTQTRFQAIQSLHHTLLSQYHTQQETQREKDATASLDLMDSDPSAGEASGMGGFGGSMSMTGDRHATFTIALERRRARSAEIEQLLERQGALVEGTREKLGRLGGLV